MHSKEIMHRDIKLENILFKKAKYLFMNLFIYLFIYLFILIFIK